MIKNLLTTFLFTLLTTYVVVAQTTSISGIIVDAANKGIPGVSIVEKGTTNAVATDANGGFLITVANRATLVIAFANYVTKEILVPVGQVNLGTIKLQASGLDNPATSGYATTVITGESLVQSGEPLLINALQGKIPGANITLNSGEPGAGGFISLRGVTSIDNHLQPLILLNDVPIYNSSLASNYSVSVLQSRINDLSTASIDRVEVIRGTAGAARWGSRGANGVIKIYTKKNAGNHPNKINVNFSSSLSLDKLNKKVPLQNTYSQGFLGQYRFSTPGGHSWGDRIADRSGGADDFITDPNATGYLGRFEANNGQTYYAIADGTTDNPSGGKNSKEIFDIYDALFKTGTTFTNNLNLSTNTKLGSIFLGISDTRQDGILIKSSAFQRTNVNFNLQTNISQRLSIGINALYSHSRMNRTKSQSVLSGVMLGGLRTPADFNNSGYTGTYINPAGESFTGRQRAYRNPLGISDFSVYDNPLWSLENNPSKSLIDRFIGGLTLDYGIFDWLTFTTIFGADTYTENRDETYAILASSVIDGTSEKMKVQQTQWNSNSFLTARFKLTPQINSNFALGVELNSRTSDISNNFTTSSVSSSQRNSTVTGLGAYLKGGFGYKNLVYLNLTGRYDHWSTFGNDVSNGVIYPAADFVFNLDKLLPLGNFLNTLQFQFAWGQTGQIPRPYLSNTTFTSETLYDIWGTGLSNTQFGSISQLDDVLGNKNLRPEITTETEIGLRADFFKRRFSLALTFYQNQTTDLILNTPLAIGTGFTNQYQNIGNIENKGVELVLDAYLIRSSNFKWTANLLYSRNMNLVTKLNGEESIFLGGFTGTSARAVLNQPLGVIYGPTWDQETDRSLRLDFDGFPTQARESVVLGNPNPEFRLSIGNTFQFKNFSLRVLVDGSYGGKVWNGTKGALYYFGRHADVGNTITLSAREASTLKTWAGLTVNELISARIYPSGYQNADGSVKFRGSKTNFGNGTVLLDELWYRSGPGSGFTGPSTQFVEDASWTRLRELTLTYQFNSEKFRKLTRLESLSLSFTGRNLLLFTPYSGFDPNGLNRNGIANNRGLDYFTNPSTKSYIFTLMLTY